MLVFINLNICVKYVKNLATCMRCRMKDNELFERRWSVKRNKHFSHVTCNVTDIETG